MENLINQLLIFINGIDLKVWIGLFSFIIFSVSLLYVIRQEQVDSRNQETFKLIKLKSPELKSFFKESVGVTAGLAAVSLYDIYSVHSDHKQVFEVLEERFPREMGNASTIDWLNKSSELNERGASSVQSYISNYAGEQGEKMAAIKLEQLGFKNVEQFESKTHANDDLRAINSSGEEIHFSVKSYSDVNNFKQVVSQHPESSHYVVNSEIYEKLESSGDLANYSEQGIEIIDGDFSHAEHLIEGKAAFDGFEEVLDMDNNISFIALATFGYKTLNNMSGFIDGKQTSKELGVNIIGDAAGIKVKAVSAKVGAKVGAGIGSMVLPGVGTFVGGLAGAFAGVFTASGLIEGAKERFKWGKIIDCIDYFGERFYANFYIIKGPLSPIAVSYRVMEETLLNNVFNKEKVEKSIKSNKKMLEESTSFLTRIGLKPISVKEALMIEYIKDSNNYLQHSRDSISSFKNELRSALVKSCSAIPEGKREKFVKRVVGEFIVTNKDSFFTYLNSKEKELLKGYHEELSRNPNHPYKISSNSEALFKQSIFSKKSA